MRVLCRSSIRCHSAEAGRTIVDRRPSASIQPPSRRNEKTVAPANQNATTQYRNDPGIARPASLGSDRKRDRAGSIRAADMGEVKVTATDSGDGPRSSIQVTTGAMAIAVSAAHASKYRPFGPNLDFSSKPRAPHFRTAA